MQIFFYGILLLTSTFCEAFQLTFMDIIVGNSRHKTEENDAPKRCSHSDMSRKQNMIDSYIKMLLGRQKYIFFFLFKFQPFQCSSLEALPQVGIKLLIILPICTGMNSLLKAAYRGFGLCGFRQFQVGRIL